MYCSWNECLGKSDSSILLTALHKFYQPSAENHLSKQCFSDNFVIVFNRGKLTTQTASCQDGYDK